MRPLLTWMNIIILFQLQCAFTIKSALYLSDIERYLDIHFFVT